MNKTICILGVLTVLCISFVSAECIRDPEAEHISTCTQLSSFPIQGCLYFGCDWNPMLNCHDGTFNPTACEEATTEEECQPEGVTDLCNWIEPEPITKVVVTYYSKDAQTVQLSFIGRLARHIWKWLIKR